MSLNRISAAIEEKTVAEIQENFSSIRKLMPFLLEMTQEERSDLIKFGENLVPFIEQTLADARNYPHLAPPFLDLDELQRDLELFQKLVAIAKPVQELVDLLNDTSAAAGSDAFESALTFYRSVRMASKEGDTNAERILQGLLQKLPTWKSPVG
jgi:hypothetical protein